MCSFLFNHLIMCLDDTVAKTAEGFFSMQQPQFTHPRSQPFLLFLWFYCMTVSSVRSIPAPTLTWTQHTYKYCPPTACLVWVESLLCVLSLLCWQCATGFSHLVSGTNQSWRVDAHWPHLLPPQHHHMMVLLWDIPCTHCTLLTGRKEEFSLLLQR